MQLSLDLGAARDIEVLRRQLKRAFGPAPDALMPPPMDQLVRSLIGGRTLDAISGNAYLRLRRTFPSWPEMAAAGSGILKVVISDVTHAERKAIHLEQTLKLIQATRPDFDLAFLGEWPMFAALEWLQRLPGVGLKVAAATLNFSSLRRAAFVADGHVIRVLRCFGLIGPKAGARSAYRAVMGASTSWSAADLIDLHCWLKRVGQMFCRPGAPYCPGCPLRSECRRVLGRPTRSVPRRVQTQKTYTASLRL